MNFKLTETQEHLRRTARDFLQKECPTSHVREMESDPVGYSMDLWKKAAGLGWLGLGTPERYGGSGGDFLDLVLLLEELGRSLFPGPFIDTVAIAAMALAESGKEEQKRRLLPGLASGARTCAFAFIEPATQTYKMTAVASALSSNGYSLRLNGSKYFVPYAKSVSDLLWAAKEQDDVRLAWVDSREPGLSSTLLTSLSPMMPLASDRPCGVQATEVSVRPENVLREGAGASSVAQRALDRGALSISVYMAGAMAAIMEGASEYAKHRVQFGRPIGGFQAIQHRCADMMVDVEGARYICYEAAWAYAAGEPYDEVLPAAKAYCSDAYRRTARHGNQIFGALCFSEEHHMPLYSRRGKHFEVLYGDATSHRERVAQALRI